MTLKLELVKVYVYFYRINSGIRKIEFRVYTWAMPGYRSEINFNPSRVHLLLGCSACAALTVERVYRERKHSVGLAKVTIHRR